MGVLTTVKRLRPLQAVITVVCLLLAYYWFFCGSDSLSPEEINTLLQNKDASLTIKKVELTQQAVMAPYLEASSFKPRNWDVSGHAVIKNREYIRLTSDSQHQVGSMWSKVPIQAELFEMELTFHLHLKNNAGLVGDGFAIWIVDTKLDIGDVFGAPNYFNGLGIFVDTYKNGRRGHFPYVNLMLGDGKLFYNKDTDGFETRLAGCNAKALLNPPGGSTKARIVYIKDGYLSVDFNYNGYDNWQNCVTLTDVRLPNVKYLGFSAETGDLAENVDVVENKVFALFEPETGNFIESIQQLEGLIQDQNDLNTELEGSKKAGGRHRLIKKKANPERLRKSLLRLRNAERRIKEREKKLRMEKYGDADATLFVRILRTALYMAKIAIYATILVMAAWVGFTVYRVRRQRQRPKVTGLLD